MKLTARIDVTLPDGMDTSSQQVLASVLLGALADSDIPVLRFTVETEETP